MIRKRTIKYLFQSDCLYVLFIIIITVIFDTDLREGFGGGLSGSKRFWDGMGGSHNGNFNWFDCLLLSGAGKELGVDLRNGGGIDGGSSGKRSK
ncbi:MAG: hypothetical protein KAG86_03685 [Gammaproteobacteria bacterium]|nr:hypothetical protein [Gammaproteobacteria bacterium]